MKTPRKYMENINQKMITEEMLGFVLYSINKRAKNCRDKKKEYYDKGKSTGYSLCFANVERYKEKEQEYYRQKDLLLKEMLEPIAIHENCYSLTEKIRYFDYEDEFELYQEEAVNTNSYFDRDEGCYVEFLDVLETKEAYNYYLYFMVDEYSFHLPISKDDIEDIKKDSIEIIRISDLITYGRSINNLISNQFVKKFIELIESKDYEFIRNAKHVA